MTFSFIAVIRLHQAWEWAVHGVLGSNSMVLLDDLGQLSQQGTMVFTQELVGVSVPYTQ